MTLIIRYLLTYNLLKFNKKRRQSESGKQNAPLRLFGNVGDYLKKYFRNPSTIERFSDTLLKVLYN